MVKKTSILKVMKKILLCIWWQDIEKSGFILRILSLAFSGFLSFCVYVWLYESNMNLFLKIIIGCYLISNILLYFPGKNLWLHKRDKLKYDNLKDDISEASWYFISDRIYFLFSFIILFIYFKNIQINNNGKVKEENHEDKVSG